MVFDTTTTKTWRHVNEEMNPADLGTRGLTIAQTLKITWLDGLTWIKNEEEWPKKLNIKNVETQEVIEETCIKVTINELLAIWHRFSNFKLLQNTIPYVFRTMRKEKPKSLSLTVEEKQQATNFFSGVFNELDSEKKAIPSQKTEYIY